MPLNNTRTWNAEKRKALSEEKSLSYGAGRRWAGKHNVALAGRRLSAPGPRSDGRRWSPTERPVVAALRWAAYKAGRSWRRKYMAGAGS